VKTPTIKQKMIYDFPKERKANFGIARGLVTATSLAPKANVITARFAGIREINTTVFNENQNKGILLYIIE
jgi:hypothetical protein